MAIPRSYSGNQFLFQLDKDGDPPGLLRSISGGGIKGQVVDEGLGGDHARFKHLGTVEFEKIDIEVALGLAKPILVWIQDSWRRSYERRTGVLIHADFDFKARMEQSFAEALIAEAKFPTLDGASKDPAYLSVSIEVERSELKKGDGNRIRGLETGDEKKWLASNFRLNIDGMNCSMVNKIDGWSVKQKIKKVYNGAERFPEIEPTGIEFGDLTVYMALDHAGEMMDWHQKYVLKGGADTTHEKGGSIEFLAPNMKEVLFTITLNHIGIKGFTIESSKGGQAEIKRAKIELYVESMDLKW